MALAGGRLDLHPRRAAAVWRRNLLVWRRLAIPSLLGNLADPLIYLVGLGLGLGALMPPVQGVSYVTFLATGTVAFSTMNGATFEALYSGFTRMHVQRTWEAIMNAPVSLDDVVLAEMLWAATKSALSGAAILAVVAAFGLASWSGAAAALPVVVLTGLAFAGLGLAVMSLAPSYDFFMYYFTLFISPMAMLSGVFFPTDQLPTVLARLTAVLPLSHAVDLIRPLLLDRPLQQPMLHVLVLAGYALAGLAAALLLTRRRLLG